MKATLLSILFILSASCYAAHCDRPVSGIEFVRIQQSLKPSRSEDFRRNQIIELIHHHCFTSLQLQTLMKFVTSDDSRIAIGRQAFIRVVDPENFYSVYDAFISFSMAFRLHDMVQNQVLQPCLPAPPVVIEQPVIVCEPSPEQWSQINSAIRRQSFPSDKLDMARLIVKDYCFNVGQIHGLMNNFTFSSGKLEMAKLAYNSCIDPYNYFQLIDVLTFPSEKEELRRYIENSR